MGKQRGNFQIIKVDIKMAPRNADDKERCYDCLSFRQQVDRFIGSAETTNKSVTSMVEKIERSLEKVNDRYSEVDSSVSMLNVKVDGVIEDIQYLRKHTSGRGYQAITPEIISQLKRQEEDLTDRIQTKLKLENIEKSGIFNRIVNGNGNGKKKWYEYLPFIVSALILLSILVGFGYWFFKGPGDMDPETVKAIKKIVEEKKYGGIKK